MYVFQAAGSSADQGFRDCGRSGECLSAPYSLLGNTRLINVKLFPSMPCDYPNLGPA